MELGIKEINKKVSEESLFVAELKREIARVIVGQDEVIDRILTGLLANGHILIEGVPGLAKTLNSLQDKKAAMIEAERKRQEELRRKAEEAAKKVSLLPQ